MKNSGDRGISFVKKLFLFFGIIILAVVSVAVYGEVRKKRQIQSQIEQLQQEAERIGRENVLLQDKIAYLGSQDYQAREAKDKLNLQSPDENVVIVKPGIAKEDGDKSDLSAVNPPAPVKISNPVKWWNYFFKF